MRRKMANYGVNLTKHGVNLAKCDEVGSGGVVLKNVDTRHVY